MLLGNDVWEQPNISITRTAAATPQGMVEYRELAERRRALRGRQSRQADDLSSSAPGCAAGSQADARPRASSIPTASGPLDVVHAADLADQRVGADRDHEQDDQQRVHLRHVEDAVGLDHQGKPMPRLESLVSARSVPMSATPRPRRTPLITG